MTLGVKTIRTAIRNPRGNPCERYIKIVGICLRIACGSDHTKWYESLLKVEDFINYSYSEATNELPVEIQFGRKISLEIEKLIKYPPSEENANWEERKNRVYQRLIGQAKKSSNYHRSRFVDFRPGQKVLVRKGWVSNKSQYV